MWRDAARGTIDAVLEDCRRDNIVTEQAIVSQIDQAYPFGERDHWPYKAWLAERHIAIAALRGDVLEITSLGGRHKPWQPPPAPLVPVPEIEEWLKRR